MVLWCSALSALSERVRTQPTSDGSIKRKAETETETFGAIGHFSVTRRELPQTCGITAMAAGPLESLGEFQSP